MFRVLKSLLIFPVSLIATTYAGDHTGNGGDLVRLLFKQAQIDAPKELEQVLDCSFPSWVTPETKQWVMEHKEELAQDIMLSNHIWTDENPKNECAWTDVGPSDIHFSFPACKTYLLNPSSAFEMLVHESSHHLGVSDEQEADNIAKAISQSFRADSCTYDANARLNIGDLYRKALSKNGRYLAKYASDSNYAVEIWDLNRGKRIFSFYKKPTFGKTENAVIPEFMNFTADEKKFFYLRENDELEVLDLETLAIKKIETPYPSKFDQRTRVGFPIEASDDGRYYSWIDTYYDQKIHEVMAAVILFDFQEGKFFVKEGPGLARLKFQKNSPYLDILYNSYDIAPGTYVNESEQTCLVQVWDYLQKSVVNEFRAIDWQHPEGKNYWRCEHDFFSKDGSTLHLTEEFIQNEKPSAGVFDDRLWDVNTGLVTKEKRYTVDFDQKQKEPAENRITPANIISQFWTS